MSVVIRRNKISIDSTRPVVGRTSVKSSIVPDVVWALCQLQSATTTACQLSFSGSNPDTRRPALALLYGRLLSDQTPSLHPHILQSIISNTPNHHPSASIAMSPVRDDSPRDASSSTAADKAISTLRARLCSEDPFPAFHGSSSAGSYPNHNDVYRQLRNAFSATTSSGLPCTSDTGRAIMDKLAGRSQTPDGTSPH